jgi:hypothetical protein
MVNDTSPYCQSARFSSKAAAGAAYTPLQELVLAEETICDLSVYRLKITEGWHVPRSGIVSLSRESVHESAQKYTGRLDDAPSLTNGV